MEHKLKISFQVEQEARFFPEVSEDRVIKVRLDKWLWAARFFKTRALARAAVENGRIMYNGQIIAPSSEIELGAQLIINQGHSKKASTIKGLSTRRRSTDEAVGLYEELPNPSLALQAIDNEFTQIYNKPGQEPRRAVRFLRRTVAVAK